MKILNLYAGLGGNRKMWEGHEITAVELEYDIAEVYHKNFPGDIVIQTDAHKFLLDHHSEFDFIWASPPCQTHSRMMKATRHNLNKYPDMRLYEEIIFLSNFFNGLWVVENVKPYYPPLIHPKAELGRHLFWSNFHITNMEMKNIKGFITKDTAKDIEELKRWIGIEYDGNIYYKDNHSPGQVLRNCVHPTVGLHVLNCAEGKFIYDLQKQATLF